ncbi:helix-turn-helix transcriptional regulator [Clostridium oryzae]|uniref:HTH domain protein n=1 Tax=Clostridium oryzae TaxID=1450648 RepID=A0A1V4I3T1_9CLOT|nr:YafY family protein [Clostridium oryzae]OPJ54633.1 HTH domain protein [Clostridium oryzae]
MKLNRLIDIIFILLNRQNITANELAERFNVSVRTIYRDIDTLSECGVPIYTSKGYMGGISLMEGFTLSKAFLTEEERENIIFALETLQITRSPDSDQALEKLSSLFKVKQQDWICIDYVPWGSETNNLTNLKDVKRGILQHRYVSFDYVNTRNEKAFRTVEPLQLIFKEHSWYLKSWDTNKKDFRMFKLIRMRNFKVTDRVFDSTVVHEQIQPSSDELKRRPVVKVTLEFTEAALYRLYDNYNYEDVIRNENGTYTVVAEYAEDDWLYGYILSFGRNVKVIEPAYIRDIIISKIQEMVKLYNQYDS